MRRVISFLLKIVLFYLFWLLCDKYLSNFSWFKNIWYYPQYLILKELMFVSTGILSKGLLLSVDIIRENMFLLEGRQSIEIGIPCIGYEVMYYFSAFIVSYPGKWKNKLIFIPIGLVLINILNIFRIVLLSLIFLYYPQYADFNHHFLFTFIIYSVIFSIWLVWIKYFSTTVKTDTEKELVNT